MRSRKDTFARIAEALVEKNVSIDRITWLDVVSDNDNGARDYLEDEILSDGEERLKEVFGAKFGAYLDALCESGETSFAADSIIEKGGWVVQASHQAPDINHVRFENDKPRSWRLEPCLCFHFFHHHDLSIALCKALAWARRIDRRAFAEALKRQGGKA